MSTLPVHAYPHANDHGTGWVEIILTGDAPITLARAVAQRLTGQGITGPRVTEAIVEIIARAITDTGISLDAQTCDDLAHHLTDAAAQAVSVELAEAVEA